MVDTKTMMKEEIDKIFNLRFLEIRFDPSRCTGVWQCYEVCPVGCWTPDYDARVVTFHDKERCVACGACVLQCPEGAIQLIDPRKE